MVRTDDGLNFLHVTDIPKLPDANNKVDGSGKHENPSIEDNENSAKVKGSDDDNARQLFQKFTTSPGLPDNHVLDIIPLTHGKMAAATNQGIVLFNSFSDQDQDLKGLPSPGNTKHPIRLSHERSIGNLFGQPRNDLGGHQQ